MTSATQSARKKRSARNKLKRAEPARMQERKVAGVTMARAGTLREEKRVSVDRLHLADLDTLSETTHRCQVDDSAVSASQGAADASSSTFATPPHPVVR